MIKFKATAEQLKKLYCLLYNASAPVGMGLLHYRPEDMTEDQIPIDLEKGFYMDYVRGRMVKFMCRATNNPGEYTTFDTIPRSDYQSWVRTYPTILSVLEAAGITDITVEPSTT